VGLDFSLPALVLSCIRAMQVLIQVEYSIKYFVESRPHMSKVLFTGSQAFIGGFECVTALDYMLDEVNPSIEHSMSQGKF